MSTEHEMDYRYRGGEWTWFVRSCKTGRFRAGEVVAIPGSVIVTCPACNEIAYSAIGHESVLPIPEEWTLPPLKLAEQDSEPGVVSTQEIVDYAEEHNVRWAAACDHFTELGRDIGDNKFWLLPPMYNEMLARRGRPVPTAEDLAAQAEIERLSEAAAKIPGRDAWAQ